MSFFDEIPEPEFEVRQIHRRPEWAGPPENMVGATVPVDAVLANLAVVLAGVTAFPTGALLAIEVLRRVLDPRVGGPCGRAVARRPSPRRGRRVVS